MAWVPLKYEGAVGPLDGSLAYFIVTSFLLPSAARNRFSRDGIIAYFNVLPAHTNP